MTGGWPPFSDAVVYAFAAGMVAAFNPCGFAMLPAYLSFFLGLEERTDERLDGGVLRALRVSALMTAGFVAVFGIMGVVVTQLFQAVQQHLKWLTIAIGIGLVALGVATLAGRSLKVRLPRLQLGGGDRSAASTALFGASYATASLTCTIAPFLAATSTTFRNHGLLAGVVTFVAYGLGMGVLVTALTLAVALARASLVQGFRRVVRFVPVLSGAMLVVSGAYIAYYGVYEVRQARDISTRDPLIDAGFALSADIQGWIETVGPGRLGGALALLVGCAVAASLTWRARRRAAARAAAAPAAARATG